MKDFPKPQCGVMSAPKLDEEVKEQMKMRGKDPHYGSEKSLYKPARADVGCGGTTHMPMVNKEAKVFNEDIYFCYNVHWYW